MAMPTNKIAQRNLKTIAARNTIATMISRMDSLQETLPTLEKLVNLYHQSIKNQNTTVAKQKRKQTQWFLSYEERREREEDAFELKRTKIELLNTQVEFRMVHLELKQIEKNLEIEREGLELLIADQDEEPSIIGDEQDPESPIIPTWLFEPEVGTPPLGFEQDPESPIIPTWLFEPEVGTPPLCIEPTEVELFHVNFVYYLY